MRERQFGAQDRPKALQAKKNVTPGSGQQHPQSGPASLEDHKGDDEGENCVQLLVETGAKPALQIEPAGHPAVRRVCRKRQRKQRNQGPAEGAYRLRAKCQRRKIGDQRGAQDCHEVGRPQSFLRQVIGEPTPCGDHIGAVDRAGRGGEDGRGSRRGGQPEPENKGEGEP